MTNIPRNKSSICRCIHEALAREFSDPVVEIQTGAMPSVIRIRVGGETHAGPVYYRIQIVKEL